MQAWARIHTCKSPPPQSPHAAMDHSVAQTINLHPKVDVEVGASVQGYLAHKKSPPPPDYHKSLEA